ncbi:hypothetical protein MKW92_045355 [Papaver armeniacum]|nr:hypothetical protein MKW92_045355 [Papaver armeniacum]
MNFHVAPILVSLVLLFTIFQFKNEPGKTGFDIVVKNLEGFKNGMYHFCVHHPHLTLMRVTIIMTEYVRLVWMNRVHELGFAKRRGLDMVMTRRVLMSLTGLMTLIVIEIQSIIMLTFLSSLFVTLVSLVVVTFDNDTSGFTEGVCTVFFCISLLRGVKHPYLLREEAGGLI